MDTRSTNEPLDALLAGVLRAGVLLSAFLVLAGGVAFLASHGLDRADYGTFRGTPAELRSLRGIAAAALRLDPRAIIQAGLLLLIATPVARVISAVVGFGRQRDWLYVGIGLTVLALLGYSTIAGA